MSPPAGLTTRQLRQRRDRRRANLIAAVSTVVVFGALAWLVLHASGWPKVHQAFFNGHEFRLSFPKVLAGFWLNVRIFVVCEVLILVLALFVALARSSRAPAFFPLRVLSTVYVDLFRGVPILLVLFLFTFGIPALRLGGVPKDPVFWAGTALVLSYSAYVSEVYRAGIDSVHDTQRAAARAIGLSNAQALRHVVLPQAIRRVVPPLLNDFIALQKETSLVSVVGPVEAVRRADIQRSLSFNFTSLLAAALLFLAITIPLTRLTDHLLARERAR